MGRDVDWDLQLYLGTRVRELRELCLQVATQPYSGLWRIPVITYTRVNTLAER